MIFFVRIHYIAPDTRSEGTKFLRKLARCSNEKFPEHPAQLFTNRTGAQNQVHWVFGAFESLADHEGFSKEWWSDEDIKAIIAEAQGKGYFTGFEDTYYNSVEL